LSTKVATVVPVGIATVSVAECRVSDPPKPIAAWVNAEPNAASS